MHKFPRTGFAVVGGAYGGLDDPDRADVDPRRRVPALRDGEVTVGENDAIVRCRESLPGPRRWYARLGERPAYRKYGMVALEELRGWIAGQRPRREVSRVEPGGFLPSRTVAGPSLPHTWRASNPAAVIASSSSSSGK